jgi:2-oxoglutarate ferredoxin oxidoreductase subunit gamma
MKKIQKIIILGLGGQGVLFAGKALAHSAFMGGYYSSFLPTYGPEVQNGPVKAEIIISKDEEIYNPFIEKADYIIVMHKFRFPESKELIDSKGIIFCKDFKIEAPGKLKVISVDTEAVSANLNNSRFSNIVMAGAFASQTGLFDDKSFGEALKYLLSHRQYNLVSLNFKAFKLGKELLKVPKQAHV